MTRRELQDDEMVCPQCCGSGEDTYRHQCPTCVGFGFLPKRSPEDQ